MSGPTEQLSDKAGDYRGRRGFWVLRGHYRRHPLPSTTLRLDCWGKRVVHEPPGRTNVSPSPQESRNAVTSYLHLDPPTPRWASSVGSRLRSDTPSGLA